MSAIQQVLLALGSSGGGGVDPVALSIYNKISSAAGGQGAYWDLLESSGNRADTANSNPGSTLVPQGSIFTTVGPRGGSDIAAVVNYGNSMRSATYASGSALDVPSFSGSFCVFGWIQETNGFPNGLQTILTRGNPNIASQCSYGVRANASGTWGFCGMDSVHSTGYGPVLLNNVWVFFVLWVDAADGLVRFSINNGTPAVSSTASSATPSDNFFTLCGYDVPYVNFSRLGYIKGNFLTSSEITWLMNSGNGRNWNEIKTLAGY